MICEDCGEECSKKLSGLYFCFKCEKPAKDEFCKCEDEALPVGGVCGMYAICEKCGKAFHESMR